MLFFVLTDVPVHPQYSIYAPEYYPGPVYPMYPDHEQEDYFTSQIHVK